MLTKNIPRQRGRTGKDFSFASGELAKQSESAPVNMPAVLIEIPNESVSSPEAQERLQGVAEEFSASLNGSGLEPASIGYRNLWNMEQIKADTRFRSMYGGQAWSQHHIQTHHAEQSGTTP